MLKSNGRNWSWWSSRTPLRCPRLGKWWVLKFHWSLGLSSNLIGEWNLLSVSLNIRTFILNSIGEKIILDSHWFMKDEEAIDWREGFQYFHWTRGTSSRRGQGGLLKRRSLCVFFLEEGGGEWVWERRISFYVWKNVVHRKKIVCKQRAWKEVVCSK